MYVCVYIVYTHARKATRGLFAMKSTYLDSSVTGDALVDFHRFDLATRKVAQEGWRGREGAEESYQELFLDSR